MRWYCTALTVPSLLQSAAKQSSVKSGVAITSEEKPGLRSAIQRELRLSVNPADA